MTGVVAALLLGVAWLIACSPAPARLRRLRRTGHAGRARCVRSRTRRMGDALGRAKGSAGRASRDRGIPEALDLLAACLEAGLPLSAGVAIVGEATPGPTGEALGRVAARFRLGHLGAQAWEAADGHPGWAEVGREMARAERSGISLAPTLRDLAEDARREAADRALAGARRVGVRSVVPLMVCFLPAFVLVGVVPIIAGLLAGLVG